MNHSPKGLELLKPDLDPSVDAWFTLKNKSINEGGVITGLNLGSNTGQPADQIHANRSLLFEQLDIDPDWFADAEQVHGTRTQVVSEGGTYAETDALVTQIPGLALGIQVADCAAVLMIDPVHKIIAAVHAGWRGAAGGILENATAQMQALGASPLDIRAFVSPCISLSNFEVGREVAELFPDSYVDYTSYSKPHINLKGYIRHCLEQAGLRASHIDVDEGCTFSDDRDFYSYRREGEGSGRMMAVIKIKA